MRKKRANVQPVASGAKWMLILVTACLLAALGLYLQKLSEPELNKLLVRWLSIMLVILVVASAIAISVLWSRANGEARFREGSQSALAARLYPSPTPYRSFASSTQGYGDWPPPPPPEQRPQLRVLPDGLLTDMNDAWDA